MNKIIFNKNKLVFISLVTVIPFKVFAVVNSKCHIDPISISCEPNPQQTVSSEQMSKPITWALGSSIQRQILFNSDAVQGSSLGCTNFARLLKSECVVPNVVNAYFSADGVNVTERTSVVGFDPDLPTENLDFAFKAYFANCANGTHYDGASCVSNYKFCKQLNRKENYSTVKNVTKLKNEITQYAFVWDYGKNTFGDTCVPIVCQSGRKTTINSSNEVKCSIEYTRDKGQECVQAGGRNFCKYNTALIPSAYPFANQKATYDNKWVIYPGSIKGPNKFYKNTTITDNGTHILAYELTVKNLFLTFRSINFEGSSIDTSLCPAPENSITEYDYSKNLCKVTKCARSDYKIVNVPSTGLQKCVKK